MKHRRRIQLFLAILVLTSVCQAGSIWAKKSATSKALYADDKAIQVGDLLTVIINEDHKVDNKVKSDLQKSTSNSLRINGDDNKIEHVIPNVPDVSLGASSNKSVNGKADYKDERSIEDRITVVVQDIHPNGNLVVIGTRTRDISGDKQTIQVSGVVRPSDISYDNTVRSEQIADFSLVALSEGPTKSYNNPGWLGKFLDFIWPF
ncbi:MAG TPA: flagellar basal body L-ring protein FlgH [Anaerohalosphaeraceae bacterium]|nr:flagellar basal body L-ring protein FlgH [Anaerohalosphaeraceae bacterium]